MKISTTLLWLSALIVVLALVAAGAGLFWQGDVALAAMLIGVAI
jgi:hypothetical protein